VSFDSGLAKGCSASQAEEAENAPVLTKAVEAPAALSKAHLSAEDVDAMWTERCGSDSPASDEAAGGGDGGGVMSSIKSMSSAAADGAALVTTGVASGLQAVFGEDMDKSDAGLEVAFAKKWRSHPREHGTIDAAKMKAYIQSVYEDGLDDKTICAMMAGAPGTSTDGKLGIDDFKLIMRAGPKKKATRGGIGSAVTSAVDAGVDANVGGMWVASRRSETVPPLLTRRASRQLASSVRKLARAGKPLAMPSRPTRSRPLVLARRRPVRRSWLS
jgi:hypothetical protein